MKSFIFEKMTEAERIYIPHAKSHEPMLPIVTKNGTTLLSSNRHAPLGDHIRIHINDGRFICEYMNDIVSPSKLGRLPKSAAPLVRAMLKRGQMLSSPKMFREVCQTEMYGIDIGHKQPRPIFYAKTQLKGYVYFLRASLSSDYLDISAYKEQTLAEYQKRAADGIVLLCGDEDPWKLRNGDSIRLVYRDGRVVENQCTFVNEERFWFGPNQLQHCKSFRHLANLTDACVVWIRSELPEFCYFFKDGLAQRIDRGCTRRSVVNVEDPIDAFEWVQTENKKLSITEIEMYAMYFGTVFGWAHHLADPIHLEEMIAAEGADHHLFDDICK